MKAILLLDDGAKMELLIEPTGVMDEDGTTAMYMGTFNKKRFTFESIPVYPWIVLSDAMMMLDKLGWLDGNCT